MNKGSTCALCCQGNDMAISETLHTCPLYAKLTLNIPLYGIKIIKGKNKAWLSYSLACESLHYNFLILVLASLLPLITTTNFFTNTNLCSHLYYSYQHNCDLIL